MTWPEPQPRLCAGLVLPPVILVFAFALLGTPERNRGQVAHAQTPLPPLRSSRTEVAAQAPRVEDLDASKQTASMADAKSARCVTCHQGQHDPHGKPETVQLGCTDCHGGNPQTGDKHLAHVLPRFPEAWGSSANPSQSRSRR
jgi:hypothetical protein